MNFERNLFLNMGKLLIIPLILLGFYFFKKLKNNSLFKILKKNDF
tara:strand:- start:328 stop:462 length:135 start_codon:yes stop_codon:yes gene_type:complete